MSDILALALAVVALYLSECVVWARHGAVVFTAPFFWGRPGVRLLSRALGTARGAFTILNPLPPFGRVYVVEPWPFSVSEEGVVALRTFALGAEPRPIQSAARLAWADIEKVRVDEKSVRVNGKPFVHASSARHARAAADVLEKLRVAKEKERGKLIDELLAAHLDPTGPRLKIARHARWGAGPVLCATLVFAAVFVAVPAVVQRDGLARWPLLVALVFGTVLLSSVSTYVAHRALLPDARGDRWLQTLLMVPAPTMAMRGNDKLGRFLLAGSHPIAVALAALEGATREDVVGRALRDLSFPRQPVMPSADEDAARIEASFRARVLKLAKAKAKAEGVDVEACFAAPKLRSGPHGQSAWCPRCRAPYRQEGRQAGHQAGACTDCGVPLVVAA